MRNTEQEVLNALGLDLSENEISATDINGKIELTEEFRNYRSFSAKGRSKLCKIRSEKVTRKALGPR